MPGVLIGVALAGAAPAVRAPDPPAPVRDALAKGGYPWYDAASDSVRPVWPPGEWQDDWLDRRLGRFNLGGLGGAGDVLAALLAVAALGVLAVVVVRLWRLYEPGVEGLLGSPRGPGEAARIEDLPEGLRPETDDPWAEAVRCRQRGDYARAVVCLFAHQLLALDRLRQVRLVPGRTGRQLVAAVADPQLRARVAPTLGLFEAVYYGRRIPTAEAFEPVWRAAEAFERHVAEAGAGGVR